MMMGKICVELVSRLGNQMFEIANGYHLSKLHRKEFVLKESTTRCTFPYVRYDCIFKNPKFKFITNTYNFKIFQEPSNQGRVDFKDVGRYDNVLIRGFYQSSIYFDRKDAEELFPIPNEIKDKYSYLNDKVCISVRRGDYLKYGNMFIVPPIQWYEKCYDKYFSGKDVVIASDDIEWCKKSFTFKNQEFIVNDNPMETIYIKSMCKNHIMTPSTFSWWSAYLADAKTIVPSDWVGEALKRTKFNEEDKYVEGWIREPIE